MDTPLFVTDIFYSQMLYTLTIRSPVASGKLISVDCPKLSSGYTLITAADIPGKNCLDDSNLPILAGEKLSYIGEPVALLLGPDKNSLEEYAKNCKVIAEENTPVFFNGDSAAVEVIDKKEILIGDPETAFTEAAAIVRSEYTTGIQEHWYAEPSGAVARLEKRPTGESSEAADKNTSVEKTKDGFFVIQTATQWPYHVKRSVAQALGIPQANVEVRPTHAGYNMDGKLWYPSLIACHAALGTWITGKPTRVILTRAEDFSFSPKRCETAINIASALDDKGEITAMDIRVFVNLGSYGVNTGEILTNVCLGSLGMYRAKNIVLSGAALKTNIPPQGPFAGFGLAQGLFAAERHISQIAGTFKQDPADWRKEHLSKTGIFPFGLKLKDSARGIQIINSVINISDYQRKWASYELFRKNRKERTFVPGESIRGIGIAAGYQGSGLLEPVGGPCGIDLILEKDGSLEIKISMVSSGKDFYDIWKKIAADILGVDSKMVKISCDTGSPDAGPSTMSRNITVLTKLVEQACIAIRKQRFRDPLPIRVRRTIRSQKTPPHENCFLANGNSLDKPGCAVAVVEVEIDPVECIPKVRGVWLSVDGGKIISEHRARKALKFSAIQALGWAYLEQIWYDSGAIPAVHFKNFNIPSPARIPPIHITFSGGDDEPKGIGDLPYSCIPAAFLQGVTQATGRWFTSLPLKTQDIWETGKTE